MKRIISVICVLFSLLSLSAQETYQKETFISSRGDTLPYRLLRPETMKTGEKYPLVLFLHGAGERGSDNERQLMHGGGAVSRNGNNSKHARLQDQRVQKRSGARKERTPGVVPKTQASDSC